MASSKFLFLFFFIYLYQYWVSIPSKHKSS